MKTKLKLSRAAISGAAKSALLRMRGASRKKKALLICGVVAGAALGLDPDLVGGLIEYFATE